MEEQNWLERIRGYIDLEMLEDAWREIGNLAPSISGTPEAQELRIIVMLDRGELEDALSLSLNLCDLFPDHPAGFVQGAYCLHAQGNTQAAIDHLQSGPDILREEPVYFYNLACYEVALGRPQAAQTWLSESISMDNVNYIKALEDPDLIDLRDWLIEQNPT
jgi:tetratricopeptide (TPR) repeat protein